MKRWNHTLRFPEFHDVALGFEGRRDAVVLRLKSSPWYRAALAEDEFHPLVEAVDGLAAAPDAEEFDGWWSEIYDFADVDRVWIDTHTPIITKES